MLLPQCWTVLMSHVSRLRLVLPSCSLTTPCHYRCPQADFAACCDLGSFDVLCFQAVTCSTKPPPDDHLPMPMLGLVHHNVSRLKRMFLALLPSSSLPSHVRHRECFRSLPMSGPMPLLLLTADECCPRTSSFKPYHRGYRPTPRSEHVLADSVPRLSCCRKFLALFTSSSLRCFVRHRDCFRSPLHGRTDATEPAHCG